ncbi:hypothetical protein DV737_g2807, partial [Chaetothyriales sp. CBS 132003]
MQPDAAQVLNKWRIYDETELKDLLSDKSTLTATNPVYTGEIATRPDPKCRYIYYQVMPTYLDFLTTFGQESRQRDLRYSGFRGELIETKYTPENIQNVQYYEDRTNEATMTLEFNAEVLTALYRYYEDLLTDNNFPLRDSCHDSVSDFTRQLQDAVHDTKMQASRAKLVVRIAADRKALIQSHLASQATAFQSQATQKMEFMASIAQRDAILVRIITFIALVYLPATFVSTFFSTDIIRYQNQDDFGNSFYIQHSEDNDPASA